MTAELTTPLARQATTTPSKYPSPLSLPYPIPFDRVPCIIITVMEHGPLAQACADNQSLSLARTVATTTTTLTALPTTTVVRHALLIVKVFEF